LFPWKLKPYDEVEFLRPKPAKYQGVIRVWQVNDWRVGAYSRTNLVQAAARRFEKKNIGIFVEFQNVTPELLALRLAEGERPDVISFPDGFAGIGADLMLDLGSYGLPPLADPFSRAFSRDSRAVPWMAGGVTPRKYPGIPNSATPSRSRMAPSITKPVPVVFQM
jgi:ABC-type glycerol-3-phosphate transport system substrate-binding protein